MTVAAMWCRHAGDDIIGINNQIPWKVESDVRHFLETVNGQNVVCGRRTYESFPNRTIDGSRIFVMTKNPIYQVSDETNHRVICGQREILSLAESEDIFIAGGAEIYRLFMTGKEKLKPAVIVDCVYEGELSVCDGAKAEISDCVELMKRQYGKITPDYCLDDVASAVWIRRGEFVEQRFLRRLTAILENGTYIR